MRWRSISAKPTAVKFFPLFILSRKRFLSIRSPAPGPNNTWAFCCWTRQRRFQAKIETGNRLAAPVRKPLLELIRFPWNTVTQIFCAILRHHHVVLYSHSELLVRQINPRFKGDDHAGG